MGPVAGFVRGIAALKSGAVAITWSGALNRTFPRVVCFDDDGTGRSDRGDRSRSTIKDVSAALAGDGWILHHVRSCSLFCLDPREAWRRPAFARIMSNSSLTRSPRNVRWP